MDQGGGDGGRGLGPRDLRADGLKGPGLVGPMGPCVRERGKRCRGDLTRGWSWPGGFAGWGEIAWHEVGEEGSGTPWPANNLDHVFELRVVCLVFFERDARESAEQISSGLGSRWLFWRGGVHSAVKEP